MLTRSLAWLALGYRLAAWLLADLLGEEVVKRAWSRVQRQFNILRYGGGYGEKEGSERERDTVLFHFTTITCRCMIIISFPFSDLSLKSQQLTPRVSIFLEKR